MTKFDIAISEALKELGLKKLIARVLALANVMNEKSVGKVIINTNSGSVTQIQLGDWKVE